MVEVSEGFVVRSGSFKKSTKPDEEVIHTARRRIQAIGLYCDLCKF